MTAFSRLFLLGASAAICQMTAARELLNTLHGNDLLLGWILGAWLAWTGIGSWIAIRRQWTPLFIAHAIWLIPATLLLCRITHLVVAPVSGQAVALIPALVWSALTLGPLGLLLGAAFTILARTGTEAPNPAPFFLNAYAAETLGFLAGGLAYGLGLVFLNPFLTAAACILLVIPIFPRLYPAAAMAILICGGLAAPLNRITENWRFPKQTLIASHQTPYGSLAVTQTGSQLAFYESGCLLGIENDREHCEPFVHVPLLCHPDPRQILLIGTGFDGTMGEILKHAPSRVTHLELDPFLPRLLFSRLSAPTQQSLSDPRVRFVASDARRHLRKTAETYDAILLHLPEPSTTLLNRHYTAGFFRAAAARLNPGGVFALQLPYSASLPGMELVRLNLCVKKALEEAFPRVVFFPEENNLFIATKSPRFPVDSKTLAKRMAARSIQTAFFSKPALLDRLSIGRIETAGKLFNENKTTQPNTDDHPAGAWHSGLHWLGIFHPHLARQFNRMASIPFLTVAAALALATGLLAWKRPGQTGGFRSLAVTTCISGFSLMSVEIALLYVFQVLCGQIYQQMALLIALVMAGLALGSWVCSRLPRAFPCSIAPGLNALFLFVLLLHLHHELDSPNLAAAFGWIMFFAAGSGFFSGLLFGCAATTCKNRVMLLYSTELLGACLGAIATAILLIPVHGVTQTLLLLAILNLALLPAWRSFSRPAESASRQRPDNHQ
ncbi:MAG: hypothetical protein PHV34_07115 [Verrucomicrobiae bacterium]|nr:hypothetical protein [Verrucomicrobiae bacterium]